MKRRLPVITVGKLERAHKLYVKYEPRDIFYRAALTVVNLAKTDGTPPLSRVEGLAILLQTWNKAYYRFHPFDKHHYAEIERVLEKHDLELAAFGKRSIESLRKKDEEGVKKVFDSFERILGPVGAGKSLHVLAPEFFPLWDRGIAARYGQALWTRGRGWNPGMYFQFMQIVRKQVRAVGGSKAIGRNVLKAIDELNYVNVQGWK